MRTAVVSNPILPSTGSAMEIGGAEGQIGFPVMILIMLAVFLVVWFVLNKRNTAGMCMRSAETRKRAYASGVKVDRVKMSVYVICSGLAGLAGVMRGRAHRGWAAEHWRWIRTGYDRRRSHRRNQPPAELERWWER